MKTPKMILLAPVTIISLLSFCPSPLLAAQNGIVVPGDIILTKDTNGADTGIHFSNGTSQFTGNPWSNGDPQHTGNIGFIQGNVGIGTLTPDSALLVASPFSSPVRIGDTGCGAAYAGIGLFGPMSNCSNYAILGENSATQNLFINRPAGADINFRMNNGNQMVLDRFGGLILDANNTNNGVLNHSATTGAGLAFGFNSGEGIASKRTAGGNVWGLDFFTFGQPRLSITNGGNVGIGTTSPGAPLDIGLANGVGLQVRLDFNQVGLNAYGSGILRVRDSLEVWPSSDFARAGKIIIRDKIDGSPAITLDGTTGKVSAANMPAIKSTQFAGDSRLGTLYTQLSFPNERAVDTLSVNAPADGYLHITATLEAATAVMSSDSTGMLNPIYFKLNETTNPQAGIQFIEHSFNNEFRNFIPVGGESMMITGTITLHWTVPTGPGTRVFTTYAYAPNGNNGLWAGYFSHSLTVMYFPNSL